MTVLEKKLHHRSHSQCELCTSKEDLTVFSVLPTQTNTDADHILICTNCHTQISNTETISDTHWHCLRESMWNEHLPVQVMVFRMLHRLKHQGWSQDLIDMMYFEDTHLTWAMATGEADDTENAIVHKDSNGNILKDGDSVVLIKDLDVKGANFTAKRGAAVHRISLVWDNPNQIEGRVEGQQIVILTQYVKKTK